MTLYALLKQISKIITPQNDAFYRYAIYTSDDNGGFLRTRYCWWLDRPIENRYLGDDFEKVLVTAKREINADDLEVETDTLVKMQITYSEKNATIEDADWDSQLDYCYVYIFDLIKGTYTMSYVENPCTVLSKTTD